MFKVRPDEPHYAFVPQVESAIENIWGKSIATVNEGDELAGKSLGINQDNAVGNNPNRYKQHGFHFTADNCIGCHACEAACSEKNNLPAHISYRSVGYVEGGSYPAYKRLNISMACNHCDDPVCLKGCPTRAYTKFAEYGAVLQDPDICFGCGYCTWVCPYNAPQLDPIEGQVSKCNMCVDRLEVGLKPACAAACLGGALDFGIIETTPQNREQTKIAIPGFPDANITHPNIRFQQMKDLPKSLSRPDSMPIHYERKHSAQHEYEGKSNAEQGKKQWNLKQLSSRENPLVIFTLLTQTVVGMFTLLFFAGIADFQVEFLRKTGTSAILFFTMIFTLSLALGLSTLHLGKPHRFYRAFNNLKYSPVSREVASIALFFMLLICYSVLHLVDTTLQIRPHFLHVLLVTISGCTSLTGLIAIYAMHKIYRIKSRPYWNHWQVLTAFYGSMLSLGSLGLGSFALIFSNSQGISMLMMYLTGVCMIGLTIEGIGLIFHSKYLAKCNAESVASKMIQNEKFGNTTLFRYANLTGGMILSALILFTNDSSGITYLWVALSCLVVASEIIGRATFYVAVVPTTMPGAFFWRNQAFQNHARETGLAAMPQVGVLPKTDYHEVHLTRAKNEIIADYEKFKQKGLRVNLRERFKQATSRA